MFRAWKPLIFKDFQLQKTSTLILYIQIAKIGFQASTRAPMFGYGGAYILKEGEYHRG